MRTGQIITILGALLAFISLGLLNPLFASIFDGNVVPLVELEVAEKFVYGWQIPILQTVAIFAGLAALSAIAAFFLRAKRRLGLTNLLFALAVISVMIYAHSNTFALVQSAAEGELFAGEVVTPLEGFALAYLAGLAMFVGALVVYGARPAYNKKDRFLRVAVLWNGGVIREEILFEPKNVTLGEESPATFILPTAAALNLPKKVTLFRKDRRGRYELALMPGMAGRIKLQSEQSSIADYLARHGGGQPVHHVPIEAGDWGVVDLGEISLFFQFVPPEPPLRRSGIVAVPWDVAGTTVFSGVLQVAFILATLFLWEESTVRAQRQDVRKTLKVEVQMKEELEPEELLDTGEEEDTTGKKAEGEEGKFGDPDMDPEIESKVPKRDGEMVAKVDPKKVGLNDLLSTSKLGGKGAISDILSSNTSGFSNKLAVAMSGTGSEFVMGHGSGGLGFQGTGTGGGGTGGYGRIHGLGKIDTGGGVGVRARMGHKKARRVGKIGVGQGAAQGFCSRGDISKNVRMRAGAIRACYEQQLQIKPTLAGKITIRWTIHLDGSVKDAAIQTSSMSNAAVESCILRAIRRIRFKKPEGGVCIVSWPFVFNPGG
jgi:hypothetical protein